MKMKDIIRAAMFAALWLCISASTAFTSIPETRKKWDVSNVEGIVQEVDLATREITLRGAKGELFTVTAPEDSKRLNEIDIGDLLHVEYMKYVAADFRKPTAEELANPVNVEMDNVKADTDDTPYGAYGRIIEMLVTIEIINRPDMLVTIREPSGKFAALPVKDTELIAQLHVGQQFFLTYGEGTAFTLEELDSNHMPKAVGK